MTLYSPLPETLSLIGKNLHRMRLEKHLKQYNVACSLHITESVVSQVERGCYISLTVRLLDQFAQYYQVSIIDIIQPHD